MKAGNNWFLSFISYTYTRPVVKFISVIFSVVGLNLLYMRNFSFLEITVLATVFVIGLVILFRSYKKFNSLTPLKEPKIFFPFISVERDGSGKLVRTIEHGSKPAQGHSLYSRRTYELDQLTRQIRNEDKKYILVCGPSGSGKSFLLNGLLPIHQVNDQFHLLSFNEYDHIDEKLAMKLETISKIAETSPEAWDVIQKARRVSSYDLDDSLGECSEPLGSAIGKLVGDQPILVVFDQAERLLSNFAANLPGKLNSPQTVGEAKIIDFNRAVFSEFAKRMREASNVRIIFVVRDDELFAAMDALAVAEGGNFHNTPGPYIEFMFVHNINEGDQDARRFLDGRFAELKHNIAILEDKGITKEHFKKLVRFGSQRSSNSFMINLTGYMIEAFFEEDERFQTALANDRIDNEAILELFLARVLDGYSLRRNDLEARRSAAAVLYALAAYNLSTGAPLTETQLADLSHFPKPDVGAVLAYLTELGLVTYDGEILTEQTNYRMRHDVISNFVLKSADLPVDADLKDAIQSLTKEGALGRIEPINPEKFFGIFDPAWLGSGRVGFMFANIVLAVLFGVGFLRLFFADETANFMEEIYSMVGITAMELPRFNSELIYGMPYVLTLLAYASFVHRITYGYIDQTLRGGFLRLVMHANLPLGGTLGVFCMYYPQTIAVPIGFCGFVVGLLLILSSKQEQVIGRARDNIRRWGTKILVNAFVSNLLITPQLIVLFVFRNEIIGRSVEIYSVSITQETVLFWAVSGYAIALVWGLFSIWSEQAEQYSWASRFAIIDKNKLTKSI